MSDLPNTHPISTNSPKTNLSRWIPIFGFVFLIMLGIFAGMESGYSQRRHAEATVVSQQVDEQFRLGMEAMNQGQYAIAFQHFDFVAKKDPAHPGLQDALNQLALWAMMSPTPVPSMTPTITPTPDLRGVEAIFTQAQQYVANQDWTNALNSLDSLRKSDPAYRAVDVDGMYYISLRNRGMAKLFPYQCQDTNLEGGIYDLTLAERFGPLDQDAQGARNFARFYTTGAAFWDVDWVKAQYYFYQTTLGYPNMMDSSCKTAQERWRYATVEYAKQLMAAGSYCDAQLQFDSAFTVYSNDNIPVYPTATEVYLLCNPLPPTSIPTLTPTVTPITPTP